MFDSALFFHMIVPPVTAILFAGFLILDSNRRTRKLDEEIQAHRDTQAAARRQRMETLIGEGI